MTVKISDPTRAALVAVALCDIGIGMILIGTIGFGPLSYVLRDLIGWIMIAQAVPNVLQAIYGRLHRIGEEMLVINVGFIAFAACQVMFTSNAPQPMANAGDVILIVSAGIATTLLWGKLSGRRLGQQFRRAREARILNGEDSP